MIQNFKLILDNIKRRIWVPAFLLVVFFGLRPLLQMMAYVNFQSYYTNTDVIVYMENEFLPKYVTDCIAVIIAATVIGLTGFSYLFSKSKTDLFHSLPISRKRMFFINFISGIIIYIVPAVITYIICMILGILNNYMTATAFVYLMQSFLGSVINFLMFYSVGILAIVLAGNIIISVFIAGFLSAIYIVIAGMFNYFESYFFTTFYSFDKHGTAVCDRIPYFSPFTNYNYFCSLVSNFKMKFNQELTYVLISLIVTACILVLAYVLFVKRDSEAAGKSLSFSKSKTIFRIAFSVSSALTGALYMMYSINNGDRVIFWIFAGAIVSCIISHGILEIIIDQNFKSFINNKIELLVCVIVSAFILLSYHLDLFSYDKYLPAENSIKAATVTFSGVDDENGWYVLEYDKYGKIAMNYFGGPDQRMYDKIFTDPEMISKVRKVAELGIKNVKNKSYGENIAYEADYLAKADYEESYEFADYQEVDLNNESERKKALAAAKKYFEDNGYTIPESEETTIYANVTYILKSGREVVRTYQIPFNEVYSVMNELFSENAYKKAHYSIYDNINDKMFVKAEVNDSLRNKLVTLKAESLDDLCANYLKDLDELTLETFKDVPVGEIVFCYDEKYDGRLGLNYIYPTFRNTLAFLESIGTDMSKINKKCAFDNISSVMVSTYDRYSNGTDSLYGEITYINDGEHGSEVIDYIRKNAVNCNYENSNIQFSDLDKKYSIYLYFENGNSYVYGVSARYLKDMVPQDVIDDIDIKIYEKNLQSGY